MVAAVVALVARRLRVPYSVALVVAGVALGSTNVVTPPMLTKELLFTVFLPGLLFEAAFHLELEEFWRNRVTIFSLALPGVVLATLVTLGVMVPALHWIGVDPSFSWGAALVFATLISATDPIAVVALVRQLGAPSRLGLLIEGESLLNDGTAAVFFTLAVALLSGSAPNTASLAVDFVYMIGGGVIVGGAIGLIMSQIIGRLDDPMLEVTLTTIAAYGAFIAGERLGASGVISTVTAGLLSGNRSARAGLSPAGRVAVGTFWEYLAFALNSIVFLLIGFQVKIAGLLAAWKPILVTYLVVTLARTLVTYALAAMLPSRERLPARWTAVLAWSGLRGGLAMVLALSLPDTLAQHNFIVTLTFGVVILSILLQGSTVAPLLRWLGITRPHQLRSAFEQARAEIMAARSALEELEHMSTVHVIAPTVHAAMARDYAQRVATAEERLRGLHLEGERLPAEELGRARRHLLNIERDYILDAYRLGALSDTVRDNLLADVDARSAQSEFEGLDSNDTHHEASSSTASGEAKADTA
jgi:CPA1 family monovalent cation:H+ antiporter